MLAQQLVNGLVSGATYALFALGFTLMFGVLGIINLTYGVYFSAGALAVLFITGSLGWPLWLGLPLAAIATGIVAIGVDDLLITPLRRAKSQSLELTSLMVTLGATLLLYALSGALFGPDIRRFPAGVIDTSAIEFLGIRVTATEILIIVASAVMVAALLYLMRATRLGLAIRALAENADAARLMGINTAGVARFVSFASAALGALAGALIGLDQNAVQPFMGEAMMLKGFAVIILGGLGDVRGALLAGLIIGLAENLTAAYIASTLKDAVGFILLVLTLWIRPSGLFGRAALKRA